MSAPSRANATAWLRPWPRAPPVITATRPSNRPIASPPGRLWTATLLTNVPPHAGPGLPPHRQRPAAGGRGAAARRAPRRRALLVPRMVSLADGDLHRVRPWAHARGARAPFRPRHLHPRRPAQRRRRCLPAGHDDPARVRRRVRPARRRARRHPVGRVL